jgi:hypothetical protein
MARTTESPVAPRVSPPDLPDRLDPAEPRRSADLLAASLDLTASADLAYASLEQCTVRADADDVDLTGATILDVAMDGVRIASLKMRDAGIRRLRISGGRIGTLDLSGARIDELELRDLRIDYLNLGAARATDVEVSGRRWCEADADRLSHWLNLRSAATASRTTSTLLSPVKGWIASREDLSPMLPSTRATRARIFGFVLRRYRWSSESFPSNFPNS